jgi:hypothetical protein
MFDKLCILFLILSVYMFIMAALISIELIFEAILLIILSIIMALIYYGLEVYGDGNDDNDDEDIYRSR